MMSVIIRYAQEGDLPRLADIYNYHVEHGHSTFQTEFTTIDRLLDGFNQSSQVGPYQMLVAECDGKVVGRASSFQYRESEVFDKTVETGIYLDHTVMGKGVGSLLYEALFDTLSKEDLHLAVVGIALPNKGSVALHKKFGFREIGIFDEYAFVNGKYYSSIWMQKKIR